MTMQAFAAVGSGGLVGFLLGLVGGGGSILATPLLVYAVGVVPPHVAIGTGALAVSVNAFANFAGHALRGHVWWRCALVFAALGTLGAYGGSSLGKAVDGRHLLVLFGLLMLAVGLLLLRRRPAGAAAPRPVDRRMCALTALVALAAGAASGFFGIGGGFLIVPGLVFATGMPMINAVGTSLLAVGAFGLATALNYAASGLVDWALAAEFIGGGLAGGLAGTALATRLGGRRDLLSRLFAALVLTAAAYVLYRSIGDLSAG
ncbi:sulfite exporter TauE/SafE family protein [Rhizobium sp. TRM95111]|uniref:sulfite exporter TauE/SafE family protein n=1 Tax=Rhizobium alarense TaxID=2846851 RepID=UPI001F1C1B78|nr:sulfite exporter TauE/SafE family protein [Rhizobium alarense]MCF3638593.1 sulfite exporter TauE/SafE family protein [Rhizobium alarense]